MDLDYFKKQLEDELCGAKDYIKRAIEIKPMNKSWAKMLADMSSNEMNHAMTIYKMFEEYFEILQSNYQETPAIVEDTHKCLTDMYTEEIPRIKMMHEMFNS